MRSSSTTALAFQSASTGGWACAAGETASNASNKNNEATEFGAIISWGGSSLGRQLVIGAGQALCQPWDMLNFAAYSACRKDSARKVYQPPKERRLSLATNACGDDKSEHRGDATCTPRAVFEANTYYSGRRTRRAAIALPHSVRPVPIVRDDALAADPDSSSGSGGVAPPTLPETEVIGRPEAAAPAGEPTWPGRASAASVFNGTMFQSPPVQGYAADSSTAATLINVPQIDVPATVSVVPEAVITDQQILRVDDLLPDVPGAVKVNDDRRPDAFYLRGFLVTSRDYRKDGFLDPTYTPRDFADVDRVEILQGPQFGALRSGPALGHRQPDHQATAGRLAASGQRAVRQFGPAAATRSTAPARSMRTARSCTA